MERVAIEVQDADWGGGRPKDIRSVCLSVVECFDEAVAERPVESILVSPGDGPLAVFQRVTGGRVQILLGARNMFWAQYVFQFAHEFCHVMTNFRKGRANHKWIEEGICEAGAIVSLLRMSDRWLESPPYDHWRDFAPNFREYGEKEWAKAANALPAGTSFAEWLKAHLPRLIENPDARALTAVVTARLLPVLETPAAWRAVRYLNLWNPTPLEHYFAQWRKVAPVELHPTIATMEGRLGFDELFID